MAAVCTSIHSFSPSSNRNSPPPPSLVVVTSTRLSSSSSYRSVSRPLRCFSARRTPAAVAKGMVVCMAPDEEKLTRRNPLDFPIEWERPKPGRRPDIFPQFSPMKTPLPPPLPCDPPEEDEEEEEKKEEEEEPDKEEPDKQENRWFPFES